MITVFGFPTVMPLGRWSELGGSRLIFSSSGLPFFQLIRKPVVHSRCFSRGKTKRFLTILLCTWLQSNAEKEIIPSCHVMPHTCTCAVACAPETRYSIHREWKSTQRQASKQRARGSVSCFFFPELLSTEFHTT